MANFEGHGDSVAAALYQRKVEQRTADQKALDNIRQLEKEHPGKYIMRLGNSTISTTHPEDWLAKGAEMLYVRKDVKGGKRGRPRKYPKK